MLAENSAITIFYVIVTCVYGEIRAMWTVAHLMNTQNPVMIKYLMKIKRCCGFSLAKWLLMLTSAIMLLGLGQVALMLTIAVIPVEAPEERSNHMMVAVAVTTVSVIHAILLALRRETVFQVFKLAGKVSLPLRNFFFFFS